MYMTNQKNWWDKKKYYTKDDIKMAAQSGIPLHYILDLIPIGIGIEKVSEIYMSGLSELGEILYGEDQ